MEKLKRLKKGDKVMIVSLSLGILGEPFVKHELELGEKRLREFGLDVVYAKNSLKGIDYLGNNPDKRADDLIEAFENKDVKAIICAVGGHDAYKTFPYLVGNERLQKAIKENPKIFLGYSDTTNHHLILNQMGLSTFYGQAFLPDLAELEDELLPYSKKYFQMLFEPLNSYEIEPSDVWFEERTDFSEKAIGTKRISHPNTGYEVLQGTKPAKGRLLGGCVDVLADLAGEIPDSDPVNQEILKMNKLYKVLPDNETWRGKIMFIEPSNEKPSPEDFEKYIKKFKEIGIFDMISGLICGKPLDNVCYTEYKQILKHELADYDFPILYNVNVGHCFPHIILPYNALCQIDPTTKSLKILENIIE